MSKPDREEREILEAFDRGVLRSIPDKKSELQKHREYAAATFKRSKRVNIRLSNRDFDALQKRALSEGIPRPIFIASILHKYVDGQLVEKSPDQGLQRTRRAHG
jgi:predicted DNA binding CopG/RHH family protein